MKYILLIIAIITTAAATATAQIGHWEKLNPKNNPGERQSHGLATIGKNKALLFGGFQQHLEKNDTWIFDLDKNEWQEINCKNKPAERVSFDMVQISEKKVLLFGGEAKDLKLYNDLWCFDLDSMDWYVIKPIDTIPVPHLYMHNMEKLNDSEVLIYGGITYDFNVSEYNDKTYIFNIQNNKWDTQYYHADFVGRYSAYLTSIGKNRVLLYGGKGYTNLEGEITWIFDGDTKKWKKVQNIKPYYLNFVGGDAVMLIPGIAMLFGGSPVTDISPFFPYDSTWVFNMDKLVWEKLDLEVHPCGRIYNRMTKINDNNILLYGGGTEKISDALETWIFVIDTNITTVLDNNANKPKFSINYISEDEIIIESNFDNPLKISLVNLNGITLYSEEISAIENYSKTSTIPIDNLPPGVYFVIVNTGAEVLCEKVAIYR
jgi:hypothetical protein